MATFLMCHLSQAIEPQVLELNRLSHYDFYDPYVIHDLTMPAMAQFISKTASGSDVNKLCNMQS